MKFKGTITSPNGEVSNIEISKVSDVKSGIVSTAITVGLALLGGAATYGGQLLMSFAAQKFMEMKSAKKNKKQK